MNDVQGYCCFLQFVMLILIISALYIIYVSIPHAESLVGKRLYTLEVICNEVLALIIAGLIAGLQFYQGLMVEPVLMCIEAIVLIAAIYRMVLTHRNYGNALKEESNGIKMSS